MRVTLRSGVKVNLGLAIGPLRADGFHALATVYQTLGLEERDCDRVTVELTECPPGIAPSGRVVLTCNDPRVPLDGRNTVAKMLASALAAPGREGIAARVHLEKRLPVQGGLGAGSANAAVALVGLERLLGRAALAEPLAPEERLRLAALVGSDVPLFLVGGAVLGLGRGEQVVPLPDAWAGTQVSEAPAAGRPGPGPMPPGLAALIVVPQVGVSTAAAFREWDEAQAGLTPDGAAGRLDRLSRALAAAWCEPHPSGVFAARGRGLAGTLLSTLVQTGILQNDFEQVVFRQHPHLEHLKRVLAGESSPAPAAYAALSGSGSALFGLYAGQDARSAAESRLAASRPNDLGAVPGAVPGVASGLRTLRAHLQTRQGYWETLVADED